MYNKIYNNKYINMTDFASEFKKVFGNSCPPMTDWTKPRYFDSLNSDCYAAEAALLASLTSEAYNKYRNEYLLFRERPRYQI